MSLYEHRTEPLLSWKEFVYRLMQHGGIAGMILLFSLALGTMGFHWLAFQAWIDAFLNASMLLGGMGPVGEIQSPEGKIFASLYALYAGIVFIGTSAILLAPVMHRIVHKIHADEKHSRR